MFFDYSHFDDVPLAGGISDSVNRYTPAFEKTFFNGWSSIEIGMPVAGTLNNNISLTGPTTCSRGNSAICFGVQDFALANRFFRRLWWQWP